MRRVFHPWQVWEEHRHGMWAIVHGDRRAELLGKAIAFTGDADIYGSWMMNVVKAWPYSCEHNLTAVDMNRRAWVGHAAVCLAIGCPEDITRQAWHQLTKDQQDRANAKADTAIEYWERCYRRKRSIQMELWEANYA